MKSSKIRMILLALPFNKVPGPFVVLSVRSEKNRSGDDHPERGNVRGWVIFAVLSAFVIAVLLAIAGPPLAALFTQVVERLGR